MKSLKISLLQLFAMIFSVVVGTGILNLPANIAKTARQDAWIAVLMGGFATLLITNLGLLLINKHPDKTLLEISINLLGNIPGRIINFLYFIELYLLSAAVLRIFVGFISTWILQTTPIEIMMMTIMLIALYLYYKGLGTLVRFAEITTLFLLPFGLVIFLPLDDWNLLNIFPIGTQSFSTYASATVQSIFAFLGFEVIFFFIPFVQGNLKKKFIVTNLSIIFITLTYFSVVTAGILAFGVNGLENEVYSSLKYTGFIEIALIERFEFAMMYFWIFAMFSTFAIYFYFSFTALRHSLPVKKNNRWIPLILMIGLRPLALIPQNLPAVRRYTGLLTILAIIIILSSLLLLNIVSLVKTKLRT